MKSIEPRIRSAERKKVRMNAFPRMFRAHFMSFMPRTMETRDMAPTPMSDPMAVTMVINGNVRAKPDMAIGPTP